MKVMDDYKIEDLNNYMDFKDIVNSMGLETSQAVQLFINAVVGSKSIPFLIKQYDLNNSKVEKKLVVRPSRLLSVMRDGEMLDHPKVTGTSPLSVIINQEKFPAHRWKQVAVKLFDYLIVDDRSSWNRVLEDEVFQRMTKSTPSVAMLASLTDGSLINLNKSSSDIWRIMQYVLDKIQGISDKRNVVVVEVK